MWTSNSVEPSEHKSDVVKLLLGVWGESKGKADYALPFIEVESFTVSGEFADFKDTLASFAEHFDARNALFA